MVYVHRVLLWLFILMQYFTQRRPEDIQEIVSEHLLKGRVVTRLLYVEDGGKAKALKDTDFYRLQHRIALETAVSSILRVSMNTLVQAVMKPLAVY